MKLQIPVVRFSDLPENATILPFCNVEGYHLFSLPKGVIAVSKKSLTDAEKRVISNMARKEAANGPTFVAGVNV